ncbi:phoenix isoform X2 [Trichomycterus rosablanca]|uniref:phoenix isoform X2 n=1 Tax=Trichomycterus rosablanca TaxID=2290929 RepID=UPI002F356FA3
MLNSAQKSAASQSDSDSGDSLFVTQSVTSAKRTAKRHRSSERPRIGQESDDEEASDKGDTRHVEDRLNAVPKRDSGSDSSDVDLSSLYQAFSSRLQKGGSRPVTIARRASFSFLESRSGRLSVSKNQILVNAEVGGFFKCVKKLSEGQEERSSPHLLWPPLLSDKLQEYNDDVDIQTVVWQEPHFHSNPLG